MQSSNWGYTCNSRHNNKLIIIIILMHFETVTFSYMLWFETGNQAMPMLNGMSLMEN